MGKRLNAAATEVVGRRHLRWESFQARIDKGPPSVEVVLGTPRIHHFIEPGGRRIGARFFSERGTVVPSPLEEVAIREIGVGAETALEVSTGNTDLYRDFYAMCCSIADRIQIDKQPVSVAVAVTLASWAALTRRKSLLSEDRQIGLLGELLFLERAARSLGWIGAARAWFGPDSEEHDFVLPATDAEVKTTRREERIHQISSLTQLRPKAGRRLQLISVQLTLGGKNKDAFSLATMVSSVLSSAGRSAAAAADLIRNRIQQQGWEDEDAKHYETRYYLRAAISASLVSKSFPAIVPETLVPLGREAVARVVGVSYWINVEGLGVLDGTEVFERLLFGNRGI